MTRKTSLVARCCSSASFKSSVCALRSASMRATTSSMLLRAVSSSVGLRSAVRNAAVSSIMKPSPLLDAVQSCARRVPALAPKSRALSVQCQGDLGRFAARRHDDLATQWPQIYLAAIILVLDVDPRRNALRHAVRREAMHPDFE